MHNFYEKILKFFFLKRCLAEVEWLVFPESNADSYDLEVIDFHRSPAARF